MAHLVLAVTIIGGGLALCLVGILVARHLAGLHFSQEHKDVAGYIQQIMGTLYAVLIAFAVLTAWERYREAQFVAESEANNLNDTFRMAQGLSLPERDDFRRTLVEYGRCLVDEEWPLLGTGKEGQGTRAAYRHLWDLVSAMSPVTERDKILYAAVVNQLDDLSDGHRQRLIFSRTHISGIIWFSLVAGGLLTVGFSFFFGLKHLGRQAFMTLFFAGIILLNLFVIAALDRPFSGPSRIQPSAMRFVVERMQTRLAEEGKEAQPAARGDR
jgi:hypothetical protein